MDMFPLRLNVFALYFQHSVKGPLDFVLIRTLPGLGNVKKKCYFGHVACLIASEVATVPRVLMQDKPAYIFFLPEGEPDETNVHRAVVPCRYDISTQRANEIDADD